MTAGSYPGGGTGRDDTPGGRHGAHVLVVADGDVPRRSRLDVAWPGWADDVTSVVAADGGLVHAIALGFRPDLLVGDLDSLHPSEVERARDRGVPIRRAATDKDESDTELALLAALELGARRVTVLGAFGGPRLDHALANLGLLAHPALRGQDVVLLDGVSRVSLVVAPTDGGGAAVRRLPGPVGTVVSLLPFGGDVEGVSTSGLRYPLLDEPLLVGPARGLSNVRTDPEPEISVRRGRLLVVETAPETGGLSSTA